MAFKANNIRVRVQVEDFNVADEQALLCESNTNIGAVVQFTGVVRGDENGLTGIELEHYPGMTQAVLEQLALEATQRWSLQAVTLIHRVGWLAVGQQIVLVAVAASHRAAAFAAAEYLMDFLKTQAPFWKKEVFGNGESQWVVAKASDQDRLERW